MSKSSLGALFFEVGYELDDKGLKKAEKALDKLGLKVEKVGKKGKKELDDFGFGLDGIASKTAGILSVGYGFEKTTEYIKQSITALAQFDDSLRKTTSKLGLDDTGLNLLADSTKKTALEFRTTAKTVSDAQEYLALAGYNLEEIQVASPIVVAAQKATGESMQLVSDIATDTGSAYGFLADQLDFVTDRMVFTTTKFNTNFAQLGESMKYVAPIAKQTGMKFSDLNAYIGVLANNGIKGSQAGTSLRMSFLKLQAPTKAAEKLLKKYNVRLYDSKGQFIGINNAMYRIEKATKKMSSEQKAFFLQQLFGTEAMSAINILFKEGIKNIKDYGNAIDETDGKTKEMAKVMDAGIGGMFRAFESEKDNLQLVLGEIFEPVIYDALKTFKNGLIEIRTGLEANKGDGQKLALGMWEYIKDGAGIYKEYINTSLEGFGLKPIADYTGTTLKWVTKNAIERGENAIAAQKIERDRYPLGYENIKLMDTKSHEQIDYLSDMYNVNVRENKKDYTFITDLLKKNELQLNYIENIGKNFLNTKKNQEKNIYSDSDSQNSYLKNIYNIELPENISYSEEKSTEKLLTDTYDKKANFNNLNNNQNKYLEDMYNIVSTQNKNYINTDDLLKNNKLKLGNIVDKNKVYFTIKEPPKVEININGGIFTSDESINNLANLLSDKINDNFSNNWDTKLKFESSLMGGNQ